MVLAVLALGKLCQHQAGISDPEISREKGAIPGVEYMALTTDILGQQRGGWTLQHAQTSIFAALYYGQLGRLIECHFHLLDADRALQVVMRRDLDRLRRTDPPIQNAKDNSILLVFWTCLHLLCDFIDLLDLQRSSFVFRCRHDLPWPNILIMAEQFPEWVSKHFLGQMYLRRNLDDVLHSPTATEMRLTDDQKYAKSNLDSMRWIPRDLRFSTKESPPIDFMEARLRSKYWDVQAAIFKPFIKNALSNSLERRQTGSGPVLTSDKASKRRASGSVIGEETMKMTKTGIFYIIKSIEAFHGVDGKRIIDNILAIAHRHTVNLLILAAVYRDPLLGGLVEVGKLSYF
ncbi:hypothetical protein CKAH01_11554 [Colletotrichum kahawae]|uniref:Uncharacterized protein n=1 Tax=Colletotrichum kahawae TaxID=34407 RepID=A0AAD9YTE5_COLKA|nr:hypothetical protein CKAH01_11554 [Colletotrichum kahawae]